VRNKIEGIIFDLDGTLLDTLTDIANALNTVLERHKRETHAVAAYRYFVGDGVGQLVERAVNDASSDAAALRLITDEFMSVYEEHTFDTTAPYPAIIEMLEELDNRHIPVAILSNKPHELTVSTARHYFSAISFAAIIGDGIFSRKPDPEAARYCATVMGIDPGACLYVGDTATDMKTAVAAHMPSAGVLWGFRDEAELRENGAQWIATRPQDIIDIIDSF